MRYSPTPDATDNFDWTWGIIVKSLPFLSAQLVSGGTRAARLTPRLARIMRSELTLLEALMRRLLIMLAMTMRVPTAALKSKRSHTPSPAQQAPGKCRGDALARLSLFSLFEPQPITRYTPPLKAGIKGPMPRIQVIDLDEPSVRVPKLPAPLPVFDSFAPVDAEGLARRVCASQDVLQRPGFHVARMVHQIARLKAAIISASPHKRTGLITPRRVPGSNRKRHGLGYDDFYALHRAALAAFNCKIDTS